MHSSPPKSFSPAPRALVGIPSLLAALLHPGPASGQEWSSPRLTAMANAQRASASGTDALFANPGGLSFPGAYFGEVGYADDFRETDRRIHVSLADSAINQIVSGGVAFTYGRARPVGSSDDSVLLEGYRLDAGVALKGGDSFGIGIAVRGFDYNRLVDGQFADDQSRDLGEVSFDIGFQWIINENFRIGVVGENLTNPERTELPLTVGGGLAFSYEAFTVEGNGFWENLPGPDRGQLALGASFVIAKLVPIRAGALYDFLEEEVGLSGGLGIQAGRVAFEAAYQARVANASDFRDDDERLFVSSLRIQLF